MQLAERFVTLARLVRQQPRITTKDSLGDTRYELLHTLRHGGPERPGRLAGRLGVAATTLTPMIDALEAEGYLERVVDPKDRRAQVLQLTEPGLTALRAARRDRLTQVGKVFTALNESERAALADLLDKLLRAAGEQGPAGEQTRTNRRP
ncbi:MAG: MarR family winged helix-turn-helix transcriptional regulator [Acidimicrobiales bacterium]